MTSLAEDHLAVLDAEICALVTKRISLARRLGDERIAAGGPRTLLLHEVSTVRRFAELGAGGRELASVLLRLGREEPS